EEARREIGSAFGDQRIDPGLARGIGSSAQRQGNRAETEFEQAVAARGLEIIVPLGLRPADKLDLALIEAEALISGASLRFERAVIGQEYALRAAFYDRGRNRAVRNIGKALRCEKHRDILLAQGLEPFANACSEERVVEEYP